MLTKKLDIELLKRDGFSAFDIFVLEKMFGKELAITENSLFGKSIVGWPKSSHQWYAYRLVDWLCWRDEEFAEVVAKLERRKIDENLSKLFFEYL